MNMVRHLPVPVLGSIYRRAFSKLHIPDFCYASVIRSDMAQSGHKYTNHCSIWRTNGSRYRALSNTFEQHLSATYFFKLSSRFLAVFKRSHMRFAKMHRYYLPNLLARLYTITNIANITYDHRCTYRAAACVRKPRVAAQLLTLNVSITNV